MSLYRQYRPQTFADLLGQDHVSEVLKGALQKGKVSHAYLFTGPRGTGKTSTARILARAINCLQPSDQGPCNTCELCLASLEDRLTDVIEIDAASHGLVDDARALVEQAKFMPVQASQKIYIIDEVHMLSKSAFNALLKIIEEPPSHVHFILATTEAHKVLDTIKSRCQRFDFHLADQALIVQRLQTVCKAEGVQADDEGLRLIADRARGSFRDALSLLEQLVDLGSFTESDVRSTLGMSDSQSVTEFLDALLSADRPRAFSVVKQVTDQGHDVYQFCQASLQLLRERLLQSPSTDHQCLLSLADALFVALDQLRDPVTPSMPLELAIVRFLNTSPSVQDPSQHQPPKQNESPPPAEPQNADDLSGPDASPAKPRALRQTGSFDKESFLAGLTNPSLKNLLKFSTLEYADGSLSVTLRSQFEYGKLQEQSLRVTLQEHANDFFQSDVDLTIQVSDASPVPSGVAEQEVKSIFQG